MSAIPIPDAAPAIALPSDEDQLRRVMGIPVQTPTPNAVSNRGIPVDLGGKPIPVNRATGQPEEVNNAGKAIAPGIAGLWTRAENIQNPVLRTLGKIGAVGARAIDVAGSVAAPGVMAQIPGTTLNQKVAENRAENQQTADQENAERQAVTEHTKEETAEMPAKAQLEEAEAEKALREPTEKPEDLNQQYADAVSDAVKRGVNPLEDPTVQKYADSITQIQKQPQEKTPNDFEQFYADWMKDKGLPDTAHNRLQARTEYQKAGQPFGQQRLDIEIQNQKDKQAQELEKKNKPYQDIVDQISEARDFAAKPSPTNDFGLLMAFVGVTKPESVGKIRFNQQELKTVVGTRSSLGDIQALEEKIANGQSLTPKQRKDMIATMEIIGKHAQEHMGGGGNAQPAAGAKEIHYKIVNGQLVPQ